MSNKTAFVFILLANLLLLAHAAIPHHHHTEAPIEIVVECSHIEEHSHHDNTPVCVDAHEHEETTPCFLTSSVQTTNNQIRVNISLEQIATSYVLLFTLLDFNFSTITNSTDNLVKVVESIPLYSELLVSSQGLRAPPVC